MTCDTQIGGSSQQTGPSEKLNQKPQEVNLQAGCIAGCTKIEWKDEKPIFHCQGCDVPLQKEAGVTFSH